uniref:Uncharacterized protein n=1 Tax=Oryza punctata TaxID=4537 RepID=A0A0E0K357_ORYPU
MGGGGGAEHRREFDLRLAALSRNRSLQSADAASLPPQPPTDAASLPPVEAEHREAEVGPQQRSAPPPPP